MSNSLFFVTSGNGKSPYLHLFLMKNIMKIQFLIASLPPKLFHVPVVPTFCFYQNLSNHSLPPPTCLSDHILAATNDRHLRAIHGGHRNIGALYLGFLYGFLHFLSEENQEKTAAVAGWEVKFDSICFISPVSSWWQKYNFSGVWVKFVFFWGESENIQELCKSADPSLLRSKKCRHCTNLATEFGKSQTWKP